MVNSAEEVGQVVDSGADGLVSDRCDVAHRVLARRGIVPTDVTQSIVKSVVNTTAAYFVPRAAANEVHICVSAMCVVLPVIFNNASLIMVSFVSILVVLVFLLSGGGVAPTDKSKRE